jgi:hypothetical protein
MWAHPSGRAGLRIRGERGNPVVRRAILRFAVYLRANYEFPVRLPVYLSPRDRVIAMDGLEAVGSFFAPWSPDEEPYIRLATGDYLFFRRTCDSRDDALAGYIGVLAHEMIHYQQWLETGETTERGVQLRARGVLRAYARTTDHP